MLLSQRLTTVIHTIVNMFCEGLWAYGLTGFNWAASAGLPHDLLTSGEQSGRFQHSFLVGFSGHHSSVSETVCGSMAIVLA